MNYAIYKEDLLYKNCPIYILNEKTQCYEMNGAEPFYFKQENVQGQNDFLLFDKLIIAKGAISLCQQTKLNC